MLKIPRFGKPKIYFVYSEKYRYTGSTVMRGEQLSEIAKRTISGAQISFASSEFKFKRSILFLTKAALQTLAIKDLERLKESSNRLIFDPVDAVLMADKAQYADIIVAASRTAYADYAKKFKSKRVMLIDHHVDSRLQYLNWSKQPPDFKAGYFGEIVNAYSTPAIQEVVDFILVDTSRQNDSWLKQIPNYNLHYAIRQINRSDNHKPFLKGFTAAYCNSNILIQDSQEEALLWLGSDYPYLLKGNVTEKKVIEQLKYINESFGTSEWRKALDIMNEIKQKTTYEAIGQQIRLLIKEVSIV